MLLFVIVLAFIDVDHPVFQHSVDQAGELVSGGGDGFGSSESGFEASQEGAKGGVASVQALCGDTQGGGGAVLDFSRSRVSDPSPGDAVVRA